MADFDFPEDLLQLQRVFFAADAECERIAASDQTFRMIPLLEAGRSADWPWANPRVA